MIPAKDPEDMALKLSRPLMPQQSTNHVLMVAPTSFIKNSQAAEDNHFMNDIHDPDGTLLHEEAKAVAAKSPSPEHENNLRLQRKVLNEFAELHRILVEEVGVQVHLFTHEAYHDTPDAVFPNNWFSTHTDLECGECTLVIYPMKVPNRRKERRPEFIGRLERYNLVPFGGI